MKHLKIALVGALVLSHHAFAQKLIPLPREAHFKELISVSSGIEVRSLPADRFSADQLHEAIETIGLNAGHSSHLYPVSLERLETEAAKQALLSSGLHFDEAMKSEGYVVLIDAKGAQIIAASDAGIFYGVQTLKQLLPRAHEKAEIPSGTIRDWPALAYRGVSVDLSRGPFPTLAFQKHQIEVLASFKINLYSPYFEHTLKYPQQPLPAPPGSAMSPDDVKSLVEYAHALHVTLLPEQEAFGHLHPVLKYELYKDHAETPHGNVLAPGQSGTLPLIESWFEQIAKEFPSPFIHVGADETFDLGLGRTHDQVVKEGLAKVYVDFLTQIHDGLKPLKKRLLFWGDLAWSSPEQIANLPKDMIAVPWDYWDTEDKDFDKIIKPYRDAGMEVWVSPGDSNWSAVYPDVNIAFGNIQGFARDGQRLGAKGELLTVWNDDGEGLFEQDWYGVLFGAATAWQSGESSIATYQSAYGSVFFGDTTGKINQAQKEMMAALKLLSSANLEVSSDDVFWSDPWSEKGIAFEHALSPLVSDLRLHAEKAIVLVDEARSANSSLRETAALDALDLGARKIDLIGMKVQWTQDIRSLYTQAMALANQSGHQSDIENLLSSISGTNGRLQDLRDAYSAIKEEYREAWLHENRPYWLDNVLVRYDLEIERWEKRSMDFDTLIWSFSNGKPLPAPQTIGLP